MYARCVGLVDTGYFRKRSDSAFPLWALPTTHHEATISLKVQIVSKNLLQISVEKYILVKADPSIKKVHDHEHGKLGPFIYYMSRGARPVQIFWP